MQHLDQAHDHAASTLVEFLRDKPTGWRILLVKDVSARLRVILWAPEKEWESVGAAIDKKLSEAAAAYWSGSVIRGRKSNHPDGMWQADAWKGSKSHEGTDRFRIVERHLSQTGWFNAPTRPPWRISARDAPAIALFYSFKGGSGRSTALAAAALHLAAAGERVAVLDADLDAPGVGSLLAGRAGAASPWGIVDYLLERRIGGDEHALDIEDYHHRHAADLVGGAEEIFVFPAGAFNDRYLDKLARIDYGEPPGGSAHPFLSLLEQIRRDLAPRWILIDARAGLGEVSGFLTGGLCHFHVLLGTLSDASWRGLELILDRIGGSRVHAGRPQAECLLAASMVPRSDERLFQASVERFTDRARDAFSERYYAEPAADPSDEFWTLDDVESTDAPHVPVVLPYDERLATFRDLSEVAEPVLIRGIPYRELVERLRAGLRRLRRSIG